MRKRIAVTVMVMSIVALLIVNIDGAWPTGRLNVVGLLIVASGLVGTALVAFFNWRAKLQRQILDKARDERRPA